MLKKVDKSLDELKRSDLTDSELNIVLDYYEIVRGYNRLTIDHYFPNLKYRSDAQIIVDTLSDIFADSVLKLGNNYSELEECEKEAVNAEFSSMIKGNNLKIDSEVINIARYEGCDAMADVLCELGYYKFSIFTEAVTPVKK